MKLYGISSCGTVRKARAWLDERGVAYAFHDYRKHGVDRATLENWLTQQPWEKLVNRAGMTWRALGDAEKAAVADDAGAIELMLAKPGAIKRPLLERDGRILALGFRPETYETLPL